MGGRTTVRRPSSRVTSAIATARHATWPTASTSSSIRPPSASPSAPRSPASPSRCWSTARSTCWKRPSSAGVRKVVCASSASVYGLAEELPDRRSPSPVRQHDLLRRGEGFQRGLLAQFHTRCTASTTWRCGTSTSTARGWTSTASTPRCWCAGWSASTPAGRRSSSATAPRRWTSSSRRGRGPGQLLAADAPVTDEVFNVASGVETSLAEAGPSTARRHGQQTSSRVRPGPGGQHRLPPAWPTYDRGRRALGFEPEIGIEDGLERLVAWWRQNATAGSGPAEVAA